MTELIKKLPLGWSITSTKKGWAIHDDENDFVAEGPTTDDLQRALSIEIALQQAFAAVQFMNCAPVIAEA